MNASSTNAFGILDYDGGDLGVGFLVDKESVLFLCRAVAAEMSKIDYGPYKFAFRLSQHDYKGTEEVEKILQTLEDRFPKGIKFYRSNGNRIFEIRGKSGGVVANWAVYIYQEKQ